MSGKFKYGFIFLFLFFNIFIFLGCEKEKETLATPINLKCLDSLLTWDEVPGASNYVVYVEGVDGSPFFSTSPNFDLEELELDANKEYGIQVQALDESGKYLDSDLSNKIKYQKKLEKLDTPNVTLDQTFLAWDNVEGAHCYLVREGDNSYYIDGVYFYIHSFDYFEPGNSYSIEVIALGNPNQNLNSDPCVINITLLDKPVLTISDTILSWNEIPDAQYYKIEIENYTFSVPDLSVNISYLYPYFIAGRNYEVKVTPVNSSGNYDNTFSSEKIIIKYKKPLNTPNIKINGSILSWDQVNNASAYKVVVSDYEEIAEDLSFDLETVSGLTGGEKVIVYVIALPSNDSDSFVSSFPSLKIDYTVPYPKLDTPKVYINRSNLSWDEVPNAVGYVIIVDDYEVEVQTTTYDLTTLEELIPAKTYDVCIYAVGDPNKNSNSLISKSVSYTKEFVKYAQPTNIVKTESGFSWDQVEGAEEFVVWIDGIEETFYQVEGNCLNISESYFTRGVEYQVYVKAVGNGTKYYSSDFSLPITYQRDLLPELDSPTLTLTGNLLTWKEVAGAIKYRVIIDDIVVETDNPNLDLAMVEDLIPVTSYEVYVVAVGDDLNFGDSSPSNFINYTTPKRKLEAPNTFDIFESVITFNKISYASLYHIYINGEYVTEITHNSFDFSIICLDEGEHFIEIIALGDDSKFINSDPSEKLYFTVLPKLEAPLLQVFEDVLFWNKIENAVKYKIIVEDLIIETTLTSIGVSKICGLETNTIYQARVIAVGDFISFGYSEPSSSVDFTSSPFVNVSNAVRNYETISLTMFADEEYVIDIFEQFSKSEIDIYEYYLKSSNEEVVSVQGKNLIAKNSGLATISVVLFDRSKGTYYIASSATIYVINESTMIEIWTAEDLINMNNNLSGHYILKSDIDLSGITWMPIGSPSNNHFTGMFVNPDGHVIKNLEIPSHQELSKANYNHSYGALFGGLLYAYIDGIILENVFINVTDYEDDRFYSSAAGITYSMIGGMVKNCVVRGTILAQYKCGGIVVNNNDGSIVGCKFEGIVKTMMEFGEFGAGAGGIVAHSGTWYNRGIVSDCSVIATVVSPDTAGGIIGIHIYNFPIPNCCFKGSLEGGRYQGEKFGYTRHETMPETWS